jgi:hypothetical protein
MYGTPATPEAWGSASDAIGLEGVVVDRTVPSGYPDQGRLTIWHWRRVAPTGAARALERRVACRREWRPLPLSLEVVVRAAPETKKPRCSAVSEALCRTRTGDPFLTMAVGLVTGTPPEEPKYLHTLANGAPRAPAAQRSVQRAALPARYPDMPSRFGTGGRVVMEERQNLNLRPSGPQPERSG